MKKDITLEEKLLQLEGIQKSLSFIQLNLERPDYTPDDFFNDLVGYLKEIQFCGKLPKEIDIEDSIDLSFNKETTVLSVIFSKELEDYITLNGNFIIDDLKSTEDFGDDNELYERFNSTRANKTK